MERMAEEAAFNEFVVARSPALMRVAYVLTRDQQLAEDLVQTALLKAALRWRHIEGDPEPYVRRILYTESVSWWRRRTRRVAESAARYDAPSGAEVDLDMQLSVERALHRLTVRQRAVLVLRYYEDLTEVEAAQVLGVGVGTVKSMHRQALARLRAEAPDLGELIGVDHD